ncbi:MAG TPA: ubiquitin-activating E1 FCCH domain-containing protein [Chitinophagaceae bacterium]|nr:ubiquitin-activating E1 FCCH domain-containing protein [Chitinophagaceae bacterium]
MSQRVLTTDIGNLRGFSTNSSFLRSPNVAERALNINRQPDETTGPRRGYQCKVSDIGGMGTSTYDNPETGEIETITLNDDGLLYKLLKKQIFLYYDGRRTGVITNATQANPAEITSAAHGLPTGTIVTIRNVGGMIELNNQSYTITNTGVNTFTLNGVDSTGFSPYTSGGEWIISFTENRWLTFTIFTDPRYLSTNPGWSIGAWSITPWGAPSGESITAGILVNQAAQINGNQASVNIITVHFGHELAAGDVVRFQDSSGTLHQKNITAAAATTVTVDGTPVTVSNNAYINQYFDILFRKGFDVVAPYLISTFISTITNATNGIFGLEIAANGDTSYAAAFIPIVEPTVINSETVYTLEYCYWQQVNKTVLVTFPGTANPTFQNSADFENASFAVFDDKLYIANGLDFPQKYDGQTVYLAGMPMGVRPTTAQAGGAGKLASGNYLYAVTYEQVDNLGASAEGAISETTLQVVSAGPANVNVTVANIAAGTGWNTNGSVAVGGLATVYGPDSEGFLYHRISVLNSPHTMKIGDTAFYRDTVIAMKNGASASDENTFLVDAGHGVEVGDIVTFLRMTSNDTLVRVVTAVTATSITVDGPPESVADNAAFSTNKANKVFGNIAIANGTQNDVTTINVVAGHSVQINDIASFIDSQDRVQRRTVTATAAGTITISGIGINIENLTLITTETIRNNQIEVRRQSGSTTGATLGANAPISNNLKINIWRTIQDGSLLYLLTTLPNNSISGATQTFLDTIKAGQTTGEITDATQANPAVITSEAHGLRTAAQLFIKDVLGMVELNNRNYTITVVTDDTFSLNGVDSTGYTAYSAGGIWELILGGENELGIPFPDPIRLPDPPPISKYLLTYGNQLLYAGGERGNPDNSDNVFFSEGNQPESVPAATNFFTVPSADDDITGLGIAGTSLIVFKQKSAHPVIGDLLTSQFQVTTLSAGNNIGCTAHATIQPVGSLLYFLHTNGLYAITENQFYPTDAFGDPVAISDPIEDIFRRSNFLPQTKYVLKRAVGINYTKDDQYLLFLPAEDVQTTQRTANANSVLLCYDYQGKNWYSWENMNAAGGMFVVDDDLYFHERRFSGLVGNTANLYKQHRNYRLTDYADHTSALRSIWRSSWLDLGLPEVRKKFVRCMLLINRVSDLLQFNNPQMTFRSYVDRIEGLAHTIANITTVNQEMNAAWSISPWGWGRFGGYQDTFSRINLRAGTVSKSIQVEIELVGIDTAYNLAGFQIEAVGDFRKTFVR